MGRELCSKVLGASGAAIVLILDLGGSYTGVFFIIFL